MYKYHPRGIAPFAPDGSTVSDGTWAVEVVDGEITGFVEGGSSGTQEFTLTSFVNGEPVDVWGGDNEHIYVEVSAQW